MIQFGTNDAKTFNWNKTAFIDDYTDLVESFKNKAKKPTIFINKPPPFYSNISWFNIQPDVVNHELPRDVANVARRTNSRIIHVYEAMGGQKLLKPQLMFTPGKPVNPPNDGCHPNDIGYKIIARTVATELLDVLLQYADLVRMIG